MTPKIVQLVAGGTVAILLTAAGVRIGLRDPGPSPAIIPVEKVATELRDLELRFEGPDGKFWIANGQRVVRRVTTHRPEDDVVVRVKETATATNIISMPFLWRNAEEGRIVPADR